MRAGTLRRVDRGSLPDRLSSGLTDAAARGGWVVDAHVSNSAVDARDPGGPPDRPRDRPPDRPHTVDARDAGTAGVEANARLTGTVAAVLFVLLAVEGLTILSVRPLLSVHVFVGMLLVPPVLLKIGSTGWRFARYYLGSPAYRRKGPPPPLLRFLGPLVVVLTLAVLGTGVALLLGPPSWRTTMLFLHKATFVVWLFVTAVHVLGHLLDTASLAPRDFVRRTRRQVDGAGARQWAVVASLAVGLVLGAIVLPDVGHWLVSGAVAPRP